MELFMLYFAAACLAFICYKALFTHSKRLPPGPRGLPIVGNLFDVTYITQPAKTYAEWREKYGDILSFTVYGQTTIILNSAKGALELFDKRSHNYSDRANSVYVNELMEWSWDFAHMGYGEQWRYGSWLQFHRRVFHQYFQPTAIAKHHQLQVRAAVSFIRRLETSPKELPAHLRSEIGRTILKVVYDYDTKAENDPLVTLADASMYHLVVGTQPGRYFVDYWPLLKYIPAWFPGAWFKRFALEGAALNAEMRDSVFKTVKEEMAKGTAGPSFVSDSMQRFEEFHDDPSVVEEVVKSNAGSAFGAGTDTTVASTLTFMLAMVRHPEIQRRAQEEIDSVCGEDRLPDFSDRSRLPYVEAILNETLRWGTVTPTGGLAHANVKEDEYDGYFIPAGSSIWANTWLILHDPVAYPSPDTFQPDRFYPSTGPRGQNEDNINPDPRQFAFGFGRRICPGRHFAMDAAWSMVVHVLACYDLMPPIVDGKEVMPPPDFTDAAVSFPKPFECRFVWRSEEKKKLLALKHDELGAGYERL